MNEYKFRAECLYDVTGFLNNLWPGCILKKVKIDCESVYGDVVCEITINDTDLDEIRIAMSKVSDSHVMIESLNHADKFNGKRWFNLSNFRARMDPFFARIMNINFPKQFKSA